MLLPRRRTKRGALPLVASFLAAAALLACGKDATAPREVPPTLRIVAGANAADTILTPLAQALVVEVRDSLGRRLSGAVVRFEAAPTSDPTRRYESAIAVCALTAPQCSPTAGHASFVADTTDRDGRAAALVRLGTVAGPAQIYVTVPELGLRDTAAFTVQPGKPAHVIFSVADTMVKVGGTYPLGAALSDQCFNRRNDPVSYAADGVVASVDGAGTVKGLAVGRATITASAGALRGTAGVSVVPSGRIAAFRAGYTQPSALLELDLDGGNLAVLKTMSGATDAYPTFAPDATTITYTEATGGALHLLNLAPTGATSDAVPAAMIVSEEGQYSRDGAYLYFYGKTSASDYGLWRVGTDGSAAAEFLGVAYGSQPSPSPDGTRVAFNRDGTLCVLTIATGAVQALGTAASFPRWAPSGEQIAYTGGSGELAVINADGSGRRVLGASGYAYGVDWSPDGQWLIASHSGQLTLVRVSDGETLPLRTTGSGLFTPIWRP